jgi:hypothetical protein
VCGWFIFSGHLSQKRLFINPILKSCPFRWQCSVSSPVIHHNWFLFSFNSSMVLLMESPCMYPFAYLSTVRSSQYFWWSLFVQPLTTFMAVTPEIVQAGWGRMSEHSAVAVVHEHGSRWVSSCFVRYHYQAMISDNIEDIVFALVICRVCRLVDMLQLFVVTSCKCSVNPIISLNPVSTH